MLTLRRNHLADYRDPFALARHLLSWDTAAVAPGGFAARFDVLERDDAYVLTADLPGVKEEDLQISVDSGVLTVSGVRNAGERKESETYYLYERQHGSFSRAFRLPREAATDKIEAALTAGVLTLTIPKLAEAQPRKIKVSRG